MVVRRGPRATLFQSEKKPSLRLAEPGLSGLHAGRQLVAKPARMARQQFDIRALESGFFMDLSVHGFFGIFACFDSTLRKLPGTPTLAPLADQYASARIDNDGADAGAEVVCGVFQVLGQLGLSASEVGYGSEARQQRMLPKISPATKGTATKHFSHVNANISMKASSMPLRTPRETE